MKEILRFENLTSEYELVNSEFMRVKINVCYTGKNRNHSIIEKDVLDRMGQTVYGIPVVGELDKEAMSFKGHGGKIEISDEGWKEIKTTIPYGFVDPKTPFTYEKILENDGMTYNDYFTISAYLWKGRYPELVEVFENGTVKQSMEITVTDGEWDDNYDYLNIKDATFTALCLLGVGVEPCFQGSKATIGYSLDDSKLAYKEMMEAFKQFTLESAGGDDVPEELQTDVVETATQETETQAEIEVEEVSIEPQAEEDVATDELEQEASIVEEVESVEEVVDYQQLYESLQGKYSELETQFAGLSKDLDDMKVEYSRLVEFEKVTLTEQRKVQENELFSRFSQLVGNEEFTNLVANAFNYTLEELETKCYVIVGKQAFSLKQPKQAKTSEKLKFETSLTKKIVNDPYGGLLVK